jgi:hypothetical protein
MLRSKIGGLARLMLILPSAMAKSHQAPHGDSISIPKHRTPPGGRRNPRRLHPHAQMPVLSNYTVQLQLATTDPDPIRISA